MRFNTKLVTRMILMLVAVGILFGIVFFIKYLEKEAQKKYRETHKVTIFVVSTMKVNYETWQTILKASGSMRTVKGVDVTTELSGMIREIYFKAGSYVQKGQLLVLLNIDPEVAKLHSLEAQATFAKITYFRNKHQYAIGAISKEQLDSNESSYKNTAALVAQEKAIIAEKTIRAPFSGKLGISLIDPGQYLNPGDKITTLQTLDPIYADFNLPQENLPNVEVGQTVDIKLDNFPNNAFTGKITTINPKVDKNTRNVMVEVTLSNPKYLLLAGMFVTGEITTGSPKKYLTLPQAAITYNPYGDYVYILNKTNQKKNGHPVWKATQTPVTTGDTRGNQVVVLSGIKAGDLIVTSGQLKLQNNNLVVINNTVQPSNNPNPKIVGQ